MTDEKTEPQVVDGVSPLDGPSMYTKGCEYLAKAANANTNEYKRGANLALAQAYFSGAIAAAVGALAADDTEGTPLGERWAAALAGGR